MIIWFAIFIPIIAAIVLYALFRRQTVWWEFLIPFVITLALILFFKFTIEKIQVTDTEYWGGWVKKAQYYEDWNEYIHRTCTREYPCGTDSDGHTIYCTETYDCSYVQYYPAYWQIIESNGITVGISESTYKRLVKQFGNRKFVDMHRDYFTDDGDMYETDWTGNDSTLEPVTTVHTYENRVIASSSVFKFQKVDDPKKHGLFEYPKITDDYQQQCILGNGGLNRAEAEKRLRYWNAKLGKAKEVKMFILIFQNKQLDVGFEQENYWQGGNKNEFILTIGIDKDNNIQWCHPISWTEAEIIKVETRDFVSSQKKLDLVQIVDWLGPEVKAKFVRKHFSDFKYLTVEPPLWALIVTFTVTLMINIGVVAWIVKNEFQDNESR